MNGGYERDLVATFFCAKRPSSGCLNGKLIGDICDNELFLKRTPTSDRMLAESELRYPYEGSKTLMHVFDSFDDKALILELLNGMYAELPDKKPKKAK